MSNATVRAAHIQDTANLYSDIKAGTLPAVSIVKPERIGRRSPVVFEAGPV